MPSVIQPAEFFVVGGPVQPERSCYVEREADRRLADALLAKRWCCVLGPRGIGKSSLLQRAASALRAAGTLAVALDLRRFTEQGGAAPADALELVAEHIAAELGLGVDVRAWWSSRTAVGEKRLVEFFWQIVLTNTTAPIAVLFDDVEAVLDRPFAVALLEAIGACRTRRNRERDFARLTFVLAGCTTQRALAERSPASGVAEAELVEPEDFTAEQSYRLAVAFGGQRELAQALMDRIYVWTGGQPYLTQRVARGVARKGGRLEDVERVVREQLLDAAAADKDPLLAHVRAWLGEPSPPAVRATKLLRRLAAGREVARPADVGVWERLWLSGTVRADAERRLEIRNRVFKELVAAGWLKKKSDAPKWLAAAAVALAVLAGGTYWYTQRLPVADVATLTNPVAEPAAVEDAYRRLRALPGFEQRADELWREALVRHSRAATTLDAAAAADARLRALPGEIETADRLLADFWLRRAREQAHAERREAAILLAQRAAALPSAPPDAAAYLAELAGDDWSRLERSLRVASAPEYWHMTFERGALVSIDAARRVSRAPFGAAASTGTVAPAPVDVTALAHSAMVRELAADGDGTAGELELSLAVQHAAAGELLVTLTAPSGAVATVALPRGGEAVETLLYQAAQGSPLAQLADEAVRGTWRLTVVDREVGNTGVFAGWGLRFGDVAVRDDPPEPLPIPDPVRTGDVNILAVADRAVAWPVSAGAVGTLALWNLAAGRLEHDLTLAAAPRHVALDPAGEHVLAATDRRLTVWNVADGTRAAEVGTETEFVLPPVFSADGGYVAIAERIDGANPLYSVLRSADGTLVGTFEGPPDVQGWELGPGGRYVALQGPDTVVRVLETRRGAELRRLPHGRPVERLLHATDGAALVTVDRAGAIAAWPLAVGSADGWPLGRTAAVASVSASADGRRLAYARGDGAVAVVDVPAGAELYRLRLPRTMDATSTQLSADGAELVTQSDAALRLWRLPVKPVTPRRRTAETIPTALALDRASDAVAVGLASGQLQIVPTDEPDALTGLAFFGHRGAIAAAALSGGIVATGGTDGVVRLWSDAAVPVGAVGQPAAAPIALVALSADGRYVASAAARVARVAAVADGRATAEVAAAGVVTALAFSPDGAHLAIGDAAGVVALAPVADGARERATVQLDAAVSALAFSADGRLAAADDGGAITLVAADGGIEAAARHWSQPIRWIEFSPEGDALLAATDSWLHALTAAPPALSAMHSKLVVWPAEHTKLAAVSRTVVGFAGAQVDGALAAGVVDLAAAPIVPAPENAASLVARDWPAAFGLRLNDNGDPVPFDP